MSSRCRLAVCRLTRYICILFEPRWCQHFLNHLPTCRNENFMQKYGFSACLETLDNLALSMVEACTAPISWCHSPLLLNRASTFRFAQSQPLPTLCNPAYHPLLWHPDAARRGMLAYCQRGQRSESAELMLEFKPFFSQQKNPFLNKLCLELHNLNVAEGEEADG